MHVVCACPGWGRQWTGVKGAATGEVHGGLAKPRGTAVPTDVCQRSEMMEAFLSPGWCGLTVHSWDSALSQQWLEGEEGQKDRAGVSVLA